MTEEETIQQKRPLHALVALVVLILVFLLGGGSLGFFSRTDLETTSRGPYWVLGKEHIGSYRKITAQHKHLPTKGERAGAGNPLLTRCAILYNDQGKVPRKERRSLVAVLLLAEPSAEPPEGLSLHPIEKREVLLASVRAHPSLAYLKISPKVRHWMRKNGYVQSGPAFVIYKWDGLVEIETPIKPATEVR